MIARIWSEVAVMLVCLILYYNFTYSYYNDLLGGIVYENVRVYLGTSVP